MVKRSARHFYYHIWCSREGEWLFSVRLTDGTGETRVRGGTTFWRRGVGDIDPVLGNKVPFPGDLRFQSFGFRPGIQDGRRTCAKTAISGRIFQLFFPDSWSRGPSTEDSHGRLATSNMAAAPGLRRLKQPFLVGSSNFFWAIPMFARSPSQIPDIPLVPAPFNFPPPEMRRKLAVASQFS